jgi:hypothetical protein
MGGACGRHGQTMNRDHVTMLIRPRASGYLLFSSLVVAQRAMDDCEL